jgi:hypothetical protein
MTRQMDAGPVDLTEPATRDTESEAVVHYATFSLNRINTGA